MACKNLIWPLFNRDKWVWKLIYQNGLYLVKNNNKKKYQQQHPCKESQKSLAAFNSCTVTYCIWLSKGNPNPIITQQSQIVFLTKLSLHRNTSYNKDALRLFFSVFSNAWKRKFQIKAKRNKISSNSTPDHVAHDQHFLFSSSASTKGNYTFSIIRKESR